MDSKQIEKLYIEHADDFRTLLGHDGSMTHESVAIFEDGTKLFAPEHDDTEWHTLEDNPSPALAVAAMAGAWPERLEKEHGVGLCDDGRVSRESGDAFTYLCYDGTWTLEPKQAVQFGDRHHATCAAVKALATEKRANADHAPDAKEKVQPTIESLAKRVEELESKWDSLFSISTATMADGMSYLGPITGNLVETGAD